MSKPKEGEGKLPWPNAIQLAKMQKDAEAREEAEQERQARLDAGTLPNELPQGTPAPVSKTVKAPKLLS